MQSIHTVAVLPASGDEVPSEVLICDRCYNAYFAVCLLGEEKALHLQCKQCGEVYCRHEGRCSKP